MFFLSDRVSYADSENPSFGLITCKMTDKKPKNHKKPYGIV